MKKPEPIIKVTDIKIKLGNTLIHDGLSLTINKGEIVGIVGASGSGKTTLLREILMLQPPDSGSIRVFDKELMGASEETFLEVQRRWGVLFQQNALFSSLTVLENSQFPIKERLPLEKDLIEELALQKIILVGLPIDAAIKYPSQLSGGMEKRAALARAIVLDPELLFLDEPTTGLDPDSAAELDDLIVSLRDILGLTIVLVTHDLDTLWRVTDRVAFLGNKKVVCMDTMENLVQNPNEEIQAFFNGPRGRVAKSLYE